MVQDIGRRAEAVRDLKGQIAGLRSTDAEEVIFIDVSPGRERVTLYSMESGEPIPVPAYMVEGVIQNARLPGGGYAFTSDPTKAPEYKLGDVKCFLHRDSPERYILQQIGLGYSFCPAAHLPNDYEKRIHAQHRHRKQWEAYQHHLSEQEREKYESRQERQLEATLAMAKAATERSTGPQISLPTATTGAPLGHAHCDDCGWTSPKPKKNVLLSLQTHRRDCPGRKE